ncbi:MAG TPA: ABC transporter ATP-binding protein [Vicinamibacteria bacterium]|nr:ABC transporter ATP-binding protein [Vicinamibacteria bacterium]
MTAVLEARQLSVRRGRRTVVEAVDLALLPGEAVALVGPNAAGKSTLVRALAGLLPAASGGVRLHGRALADCPRGAVARAIALVTTDDGTTATMTVSERARLGRYPHRGPLRPFTAGDDAAVERALARTGAGALASRAIHTLSAGERQLAALARGLAQEPAVLLLDEPAAHLDVGHQLRLYRVLDEVRGEGVAVLAVIHDLPRAAAWAERLVLMSGGHVAAEGPPDQVLGGPAAALAFDVAIRSESIPGRRQPVYLFEERPRGEG